MRRLLFMAVVVVVAGVLLGACGADSSPGATRRLTEADAGSSVALRVGDTLEVTLPGNPTTGYQWAVGAGDEAILQLRGEPEFVASGDALGGGGSVTLRFEAVGAGELQLELVYRRSFEADAPPEQTFAVSVSVS